MSGDVFSQGEKELKADFKRVNLNLDEACCYRGNCEFDKAVNLKSDLCNLCRYRATMDIPKMLRDGLNNKE